MNKKLALIIAAAVILFALATSLLWYFTQSSDGERPTADTAWKFEKTIAEPITATSGDEDVLLGDLDSAKVTIEIPAGAFDSTTEIELVTPDEAPDYSSLEATPIGSPVEIKSEGDVRLNEKMTVTFAFNPEELPADTYADQLQASYYNGERWDYLVPTNVDMEKGLMTVEIYHFSLLGKNKVDDDAVLTKQWIHSQALDDTMRDNINDVSDEIANKMVEMTLAKMGINDKSISGEVLNDILTDDTYKEMYDDYQNGDVSGFNQKLAILMGQKIATRVPESAFKSALSELAGDAAEDVEAVAKAAGYAAEGQYREAAKIIGEQIADKFLITTAGKIAVEVIDYQIQSWKSDEVEAAYQAYKKGSDNYFYGYNNDKGDFDAVWNQMRGVRRQLMIEAIAKQNDARRTAGMPELDEREMDMVRDGVRRSFERQFKSRLEKDEIVEQKEKDLQMLMNKFKEANFLERSFGPKGLQKHDDLKVRMDVLYHFTQRMMKDTKRFKLNDKQGFLVEGAISVHDIAQGVRIFFGEEGGEEEYRKFLNERFGVPLYPDLKNLSGNWSNGVITITEVILSEEAKAMMTETEAGADAEGCDLNINLEDLIGQSGEAAISITATGDNTGTMTLVSDDEPKVIPIKYEGGVITGSFTEDEGVATLTLPVTEDTNGYQINGTVVIKYQGDMAKIIASLTASKAK
ncbi:MAG: hypothetical protein P1P90_06495 [Patescibacteria group bacterium]|nr:hypothetical protein [Patescibacteria group bacterium]